MIASISHLEDRLRGIDHWCLHGDNDRCRCTDPLEPLSRLEFPSWKRAQLANRRIVESYVDSDYLDVAFLGGSFVEEMDGRWRGDENNELGGVKKAFEQHFMRENSGMDGVALGIAGDTVGAIFWL